MVVLRGERWDNGYGSGQAGRIIFLERHLAGKRFGSRTETHVRGLWPCGALPVGASTTRRSAQPGRRRIIHFTAVTALHLVVRNACSGLAMALAVGGDSRLFGRTV